MKKARLCVAYGSCCDDHQDCHQKHLAWKNQKPQAERKAERRKISQINTIEPVQLNRVTQDGIWEEIELAVDSGATESVAPNSMPETIATSEEAASKRGVMYEVATVTKYRMLGKRDSQQSQRKVRNESRHCKYAI